MKFVTYYAIALSMLMTGQVKCIAVNKTRALKGNTSAHLKRVADDIDIYLSELISQERNLKLYISLHQECDVLLKDIVTYKSTSKSPISYVEHMILHNNADYIEPKDVLINRDDISYYTYNGKLYQFSVFIQENEKKKTNKLTLEYDYMAVNLLKSKKGKSHPKKSNNTFIWKIFNQNQQNVKQKLTIEVYFSLDKIFENNGEVSFDSMNFTKSIEKEYNNSYVKYTWTGYLHPQEVTFMNVNFPQYFETCEEPRMSVSLIVMGASYIFLFILFIYLLVSQLFLKDDL